MGEKHRRFARGLFPPGDLIRDAIIARGWTQAEFAEKLGIGVTSATMILTGKQGITLRTGLGLERELPELGKSAKEWMKLSPRKNGPRHQNIGEKPCDLDDVRDLLIEDYENHGASGDTLTDIRRVIRMAKKAGITKRSQLNLKGYELFKKAVNKTYAHLSEGTRYGLLEEFRMVCRRLAKMRLIEQIPFPPLPKRNEVARATKTGVPSPDDMKRLLDYLYKRSRTWEGHRLYSLVTLLLYTGLKKGDAIRLRVEHVDMERHTIKVRRRLKRTSGDDVERIPLRAEVMAVLASWMPRTKCDWLFPGKKLGGHWNPGDANGRGPLGQLQKAGAAVGIPNLTFDKIHRFFVMNARLSYGNDLDSAVRFPGQPCVEIRGKEAFIRGKPKGPFATEAELITVKALINSCPDRLTWPQLEKKSTKSARRIVNGLRYKDSDWRDAISLSGKGFRNSLGSVRIEPL